MKLSPYMLALLTLPACDTTYEADRDAADASDSDGGVYIHTGALGADPQSGMMIEGELAYSPDDPELDRLSQLVVLGGAVGGGGDGIRVVHGPNGPVLAGPGDHIVSEPAVIDAPLSSALDHHVATGRWLVAAGRPVIVDGPDVDIAWAAVPPSEVGHGPAAGNTFVARASVVSERLPAEARAMLDATVRIFDAEREVCIARVTGFALEARLVHEPLGPWDPAYSDAEIFARGLRTLVADVEPLAGASKECGRGVVAVGVDAPSPSLYRESVPSRRLQDQAIDALCALPAWVARTDELYRDGDAGFVKCHGLDRRAEVRVFESLGGERLVLVNDGGLYAGFAVGLKRLTPAWSYELPYRPEAMIDVQGDGSPELVMPEVERAPRTLVGLTFAGDEREPDYTADWTPVPPTRAAVGGYAVPDFSVFAARAK